MSATFAHAQEVVLSSNDGTISLRGQLIEFSDQKYTIDTLVGRMTIDSTMVACSGEACPDISPQVSEFSIVGADALVGNIATSLIPAYAQSLDAQVSVNNEADNTTFTLSNSDNEEIAIISVASSSSTDGLRRLQQGQAEIALTTRQLLPEEITEFENQGLTAENSEHEHVIALDAIAIVTSEDNPLGSISIPDVAQIFSGAYSNWSELGGADAPIILYGPESDSELAELFLANVVNSQANHSSGLSQDITSVDNVADSVAKDPNGIGYTFYTKALPAKPLAIRDSCGLATNINSFTIKSEEYPLTQRLYAYYAKQPGNSHIDGLLRFLQSDSGQALVNWHDLIDQRGTYTSLNSQGLRLANAMVTADTDASSMLLKEFANQIIDSNRQSITFRFETGSNQMDQRAKADIIRLSKKLRSLDNTNTTIRLLGFTDSVGDFELNQELSLRRANQVRSALLETYAALANQATIQPFGYGEIAPIACNETALGRAINRRVEVWISNSDAISTR